MEKSGECDRKWRVRKKGEGEKISGAWKRKKESDKEVKSGKDRGER